MLYIGPDHLLTIYSKKEEITSELFSELFQDWFQYQEKTNLDVDHPLVVCRWSGSLLNTHSKIYSNVQKHYLPFRYSTYRYAKYVGSNLSSYIPGQIWDWSFAIIIDLQNQKF